MNILDADHYIQNLKYTSAQYVVLADHNRYNYSAPFNDGIADKVGQDCGKSLARQMNKAMAVSSASADNLFL